jgi:hypothetical protein
MLFSRYSWQVPVQNLNRYCYLATLDGLLTLVDMAKISLEIMRRLGAEIRRRRTLDEGLLSASLELVLERLQSVPSAPAEGVAPFNDASEAHRSTRNRSPYTDTRGGRGDAEAT